MKRHEQVAAIAFTIELKPTAYAVLVQSGARAPNGLYPVARLLLFQRACLARVCTRCRNFPVRRSSPVREREPPDDRPIRLDCKSVDDLQPASPIRVVADVSEVALVRA